MSHDCNPVAGSPRRHAAGECTRPARPARLHGHHQRTARQRPGPAGSVIRPRRCSDHRRHSILEQPVSLAAPPPRSGYCQLAAGGRLFRVATWNWLLLLLDAGDTTFDRLHLPSCAGSNESLCGSNTKLTGTTTVIAKPGQGVALRNMAATMPGAAEFSKCRALNWYL